jgi:hypothetical protein
MQDDYQFAVFTEDAKGPLWRGFFSSLDSAKRNAKTWADEGGLEAFVFSFVSASEVARFFPARNRPGAIARLRVEEPSRREAL